MSDLTSAASVLAAALAVGLAANYIGEAVHEEAH